MKDKQSIGAIIIAIVLSVLLMFVCTGCKTIYVPVVEEHNKDSIHSEMRTDTFYQVIKDSVVVQMPCNDSIQVAYIDRYHTNTIREVREVRDTTYVAKEDIEPKIVEVEKIVTQNSGFAKFCIWLVCIAFVAILGVIAWKLFKKFYLHK